jgi:replicative DNA helicase
VAIAALNRNVEMRSGHKPMLSDLRDSGSIEQDADVVMFLHREDMYTTEDEWKLSVPGLPYPRGIVQVIVAKNRHGPTSTVYLKFNPMLARFEDV